MRVVSKDGDSSEESSAPTLAAHVDSGSNFAEAFKNLRASLLLALPDHPPRNIVVSSCEPRDGKSTIAANLAIVLTQLGRRVLLIDGDLRRPTIHKEFGLSGGPGLSSLLSGNSEADDVIRETEIPDLFAVPCGPIPPNPAELLDSPALTSLLLKLSKEEVFDHVILDSPPLASFADPLIMATRADATVLVVRAGKTARTSLTHTMSRIHQAQTTVVGAVLNAVTESDRHYYYGHYYHGYKTDESAISGKRRRNASARSSARRRRGGTG